MLTPPQTSSPTDEDLAAQVAAGLAASRIDQARQGFEQLYDRHAGKLLAFLATRVRRSDLEDVHQAVWQRVWQGLADRFHGGNFRAWLHQIARNYLTDLSRHHAPQHFAEGDDARLDARAVRPDERLIEQERTDALRRCLDRLEAEMAAVVRARLQGEGYDGICTRTGMPPAQAHKLFFRAKAQLTVCVERAFSS